MVYNRYKKKTSILTAERAEPGSEIYSNRDGCFYATNNKNCIIITTQEGEKCIISEEDLKNSFTLITGEAIENIPTEEFLIEVKPYSGCVFASQIFKETSIETAAGKILEFNRKGLPHGEGDFIVYADESFTDGWVVNGAIFFNLYKRLCPHYTIWEKESFFSDCKI